MYVAGAYIVIDITSLTIPDRVQLKAENIARRNGTPADVVGLVSFYASKDSAYITGAFEGTNNFRLVLICVSYLARSNGESDVAEEFRSPTSDIINSSLSMVA